MEVVIKLEVNIGEIIIEEEIYIGDIILDIIKELPELENLVVTPSKDTKTFKSEQYGYDEVTVEGDNNLLSENIKKDVEIFGVLGLMDGIDTSDADATAEDIAMDKIAYVKGEKVIGTLEVDKYNAKIDIKYKNGYRVSNLLMEVPVFDMSGITDASNMFREIITLKTIPLIGTRTVTDMTSMFYGCTALETIPLLDTGNVKDMNSLFYSCVSLQEIPLLNTGNVTDMDSMFRGNSSLKTIPLLNTENVTSMRYLFYNCKALETVPLLDTGSVTNMNYMLYGCTSLQEVPQFNTENVTNMAQMLYNCILLKTIPSFNTGKVTSMREMFYNCPKIETIAALNCESVKILTKMLYNTYNVINMGGFINLGKAYTQRQSNYADYKLDIGYVKTLTYESLMNIVNNLYDLNLTYDVANGGTLYTQSLVLGSTNMNKLTAEEIAIATSKGWTVS